MTFLQLAAARKSCRSYDTARTVEREKIERCLEAARMAPSASNGQPWTFVVVTDPPLRERVARATYGRLVAFNRFVPTAPVLVVVVQEKSLAFTRVGGALKRRPYEPMDIGMASMQFCLQATEEGLGTCILGWFGERAIRRHLAIPAGRRVALVITLGYPAADWDPPRRGRKPLEAMSGWNGYPPRGRTGS